MVDAEENSAMQVDDAAEKTAKKTISKKDKPLKLSDAKSDAYIAAAECLDAVLHKRASVKSAIFKSDFEDKRMLLALTQKTQDHLPYLKKIVYDSRLLEKEPRISKTLAYVLTYDFLFGNSRKINGAARLIRPFHTDLQKQLQIYLKERGVTSVYQIKTAASAAALHPRYVRVNTLKTTLQTVIEQFEKEGFHLDVKSQSAESQFNFIRQLRRITADSFFLDYHVPNLLVFHPSVSFHDHQLEKDGHIILQDKASCIPALLLQPEPDSQVIDACAAPGMKTSHLSALMENKGKIHAVELNVDRSKVMTNLLANVGAQNVEIINEDFLKIGVDDEKFAQVRYILVDPTCSGSGVTGKERLLTKKTKKEDAARLKKLQGLQIILLKHALNFPNVQRVVYSTCSINAQEDEEVLQDVMKGFSSTFIVKPYSNYLPKWKGAGKSRYSVGPNCLRAFPEKHLTNGFFVAVIERAKVENAEKVETVKSDEKVKVVTETPAEADGKVSKRSLKRDLKRKKRHGGDEVTEAWTVEKGVVQKSPVKLEVRKETAETDQVSKKRRKIKKKKISGSFRKMKAKKLKRLNEAKII